MSLRFIIFDLHFPVRLRISHKGRRERERARCAAKTMIDVPEVAKQGKVTCWAETSLCGHGPADGYGTAPLPQACHCQDHLQEAKQRDLLRRGEGQTYQGDSQSRPACRVPGPCPPARNPARLQQHGLPARDGRRPAGGEPRRESERGGDQLVEEAAERESGGALIRSLPSRVSRRVGEAIPEIQHAAPEFPRGWPSLHRLSRPLSL